jgi:hypothetical protein
VRDRYPDDSKMSYEIIRGQVCGVTVDGDGWYCFDWSNAQFKGKYEIVCEAIGIDSQTGTEKRGYLTKCNEIINYFGSGSISESLIIYEVNAELPPRGNVRVFEIASALRSPAITKWWISDYKGGILSANPGVGYCKENNHSYYQALPKIEFNEFGHFQWEDFGITQELVDRWFYLYTKKRVPAIEYNVFVMGSLTDRWANPYMSGEAFVFQSTSQSITVVVSVQSQTVTVINNQ